MKNFIFGFCFLFLFDVGLAHAFGEPKPVCEVGSPTNSKIAQGFINEKPNQFVGNFRRLRNSKTLDFLSYCPGAVTPNAQLNAYSNRIHAHTGNKIKRSCVEAALRMSPGENKKSHYCSNTAAQGRPQSSTEICYTSEMFDYLTWAFNMAIECMSDDIPMDARLIFMKMTNESLFHFSVASDGGVGLGQLTSPALKAMKKEANQYVTNVLFSGKPACQPFKNSLRELPSASQPYCPLVEPSEGVAHNLILSMGYFKHIREDRMPEVREAMVKRGIQDGRFANLAALAMYGPNPEKGKARAMAALKVSGNNYLKFYKEMNKDSYISATMNKYNSLYANTQKNSPELMDCFDLTK